MNKQMPSIDTLIKLLDDEEKRLQYGKEAAKRKMTESTEIDKMLSLL